MAERDELLMKNLMHSLCALMLGCAVLLSASAQAATPQKKAVRTTQAKKAVRTTQAKKTSTSKKAAVRSGASQCRVIKLKGGKTRRLCKAAPGGDPVLRSPIQGNALNKPAPVDKGPEVKVRSAPDRAYAVDGEVFFFQGRKYRVAGMEGVGGDDMAKQRLQKALESGSLSIDSQSTDDAGVSTATVRVDGRNLVESLR